jgi:hypothetical protein
MKEIFEEGLDLKIYPSDSEPAKQYGVRASTAVFVDGQMIPLDIALSEGEMERFLKVKALEKERKGGKG